MKAVRINKTGGIEVLEYGDYPMPVMRDNEVLVKVMTTAVSAWDIKYRRGDIFGKTKHSLPGRKSFPLPQQLGREAAGIVVAVGETVTAFNVGDRVMGLVHPENQMSKNALMGLGNLSTGIDYPGHVMLGGYAQYVSRPENYWLKMPDNLSFDVVAAGAWSYPTSHRILFDRCRIKIGDSILVTGISGSIGNAILNWGKLAGCKLIGTTTNENKIDNLKAIGVDEVVVSTDKAAALEQIMQITDGEGVNHAVELTGASDLKSLCLDSLACGATICPLGESTDDDSFSVKIKEHLVGKEISVVGIRGSTLQDQYLYLKMLSAGKINVPISEVYPLKEVKIAHQRVEMKQVIGKVLLHPWDE